MPLRDSNWSEYCVRKDLKPIAMYQTSSAMEHGSSVAECATPQIEHSASDVDLVSSVNRV